MVGHKVTFGILLTDEFGSPIWGEVNDWIEHYYEKNQGYPNFIISFPSSGDNQLTLGFSIRLNRNIDIEKLDQRWKSMIEELPADFLEIYNQYEEETPDIHVVSGYF